MEKVLCAVDNVLSAHTPDSHWRVHNERARTELLDALGAERDKPLVFFGCSIGSAKGSGGLAVYVCGCGASCVNMACTGE